MTMENINYFQVDSSLSEMAKLITQSIGHFGPIAILAGDVVEIFFKRRYFSGT